MSHDRADSLTWSATLGLSDAASAASAFAESITEESTALVLRAAEQLTQYGEDLEPRDRDYD